MLFVRHFQLSFHWLRKIESALTEIGKDGSFHFAGRIWWPQIRAWILFWERTDFRKPSEGTCESWVCSGWEATDLATRWAHGITWGSKTFYESKNKRKDSINFNFNKHWLSSTFFFRITLNFPSFMQLIEHKNRSMCVVAIFVALFGAFTPGNPFLSYGRSEGLRLCGACLIGLLRHRDGPRWFRLGSWLFLFEDAWIPGGPPSSNKSGVKSSHINGLVEAKLRWFHLTKKGPHTVTPFITGCLGLPTVQDCQVMQAVTFLTFESVIPHILSGVKLRRRFRPNEKWPSTKFADWRESPPPKTHVVS